MEIGRDQFALRRLCKKRRSFFSKEDCITCLPEHIIYLILDRLPLKDAARTCILSKAWNRFLSSYPILRFDHNLFALPFLLAVADEQEPDIHGIGEKFIDYVGSNLSKVKEQDTSVRKLALNVAVNDSKYFPRIDHLMGLVMKLRRVEELCLFIQTHDSRWDDGSDDEIGEDDVFYSVPFSVVLVNGLHSLHICAGNFANIDIAMVGSAAYSSLQRLSLVHAIFDEQLVLNLTRFCPRIEVLEFDHCNFWVESLALSLFPRLKKASFCENLGWLNEFIVDNSSLESLKYDGFIPMCDFIAAACGSIRELILTQSTPPNLCVDLASTFPFLEEAELTFKKLEEGQETFKAANHHLRKLYCYFSVRKYQVKEIWIECPNLQWFRFVGRGLKKVYIDSPKLTQLHYIGNELPVLNMSTATSFAVKDMYFHLRPIKYFGIPWFIQLRELIEQIAEAGRTIHLKLTCNLRMVEFVPTKFSAFKASRQNNAHMELDLGETKASENPAALVDGLIWSTCPTSLSISSIYCTWIKAVIVYKECLVVVVGRVRFFRACVMKWQRNPGIKLVRNFVTNVGGITWKILKLRPILTGHLFPSLLLNFSGDPMMFVMRSFNTLLRITTEAELRLESEIAVSTYQLQI